MSNELATIDHTSNLALTSEQTYWTEAQVAALRHIGVEHANEGDLTVFHHVCQRTGLDPFARQIYMIGRNARELVNGEWKTVVKQTIQTGIDGFRLIGRRAADRGGHTISVAAPEWAHEDGSWRPVWMKAWGTPVAARVTIKRSGEPFTAVALFDEYAQTNRDGELTAMWRQRSAGQIAKCAEALAWRMAFPQDLSGIYTDDEMGQADNRGHQVVTATVERSEPRGLGAALAQQASGAEGDDPSVAAESATSSAPEPDSEPPKKRTAKQKSEPDSEHDPAETDLTDKTRKRLFALFGELGIHDRDEQIRGISHIIGRPIASRSELMEADAQAVIDVLAKKKGAAK